jgi:hypothetical protein
MYRVHSEAMQVEVGDTNRAESAISRRSLKPPRRGPQIAVGKRVEMHPLFHFKDLNSPVKQ